MQQPWHILIIEDDAAIAQSLMAGLEENGFSVTWRATGAAGITFVRDHNPHLILLDVRLPDISGFDVCQRLRRLQLTQPVIMLTVQDGEMDKVLGLELGADDYMTKPYSLRELISRVRAHLRRVYGELSSASKNVLYVEDLIIDLDRGQVSRIAGASGSLPLHLTPTEFRLLVHLARHRGQALSRAQLLEAVWGWDANVEDEKTVNVHIRRLREKIEIDPGRPNLVLTAPGIGYRLAG